MIHRRLVSLVGKVPVYRAGGSGSIPDWTNTEGLKKLRRKYCLCYNVNKWLDLRVFSDKDRRSSLPTRKAHLNIGMDKCAI